jgi:hypothetical protein
MKVNCREVRVVDGTLLKDWYLDALRGLQALQCEGARPKAKH